VDLNGQTLGAESWANLCATTAGAVLKNSSATAASIAAGNTIWIWDGATNLTINAGIGDIRIHSRITSSGQATPTGLIKTGTNALVLSGNSDYTGATVVSAGTLNINGNNAAATGALTVASGATLGGSGTIGGATTISGIHRPGNSAGVQTFASHLIYSGTPTVEWELASNTTTQGSPTPVFDQILVNGNLDFSVPTTLTLNFALAGSTVDWNNALWANDITGTSGWLVYDVAGALGNFYNLSISVADWADGAGAFLQTVRAGSSFSLYNDGSDIYLNYAVPEPSTYALLVLAASGCGAHFFRRRRNVQSPSSALASSPDLT
jgi:autotransporter-associated beta strand protein